MNKKTDSRGQRDQWLDSSDEALLRACHIDTFRASGPGGQKRNKTDSAVRLRHEASGLDVIASESRSQHENKARALKRLRMAIALHVREEVGEGWHPTPILKRCRTAGGRIEVSSRNPDYPRVIAVTLDVIDSCGGAIRESAQKLEISTAQLSRWISRDDKVFAAVNVIRRCAGLRTL